MKILYKGVNMNHGLLMWNLLTIFNTVLVQVFETPFGSDILASFTDFHCRSIDNFGAIWVQTFEVDIQGSLLVK